MAALGGKTNESPSCSKERSYESTSSERGQFCDQHAAESIVGVQNNICAYSGCFRHRSHGVARSRRSEFCPEHVVDVVVRISCKEELEECSDRQPELGAPGDNSASEAYSAPASDDMVDVVSRRCASETCIKGPVFGFEGSQKAMLCAGHELDGMIGTTQRTCVQEAVCKGPSSGIADTNRNVLHCPGGAPAGLGSVAGVSWGYPSAGTPIGRSYSPAAAWTGEGFAAHTQAMGRMIDITPRTFAHNVVLQGPSPGIAYTAGNVLYRPSGAPAGLGSVAGASWGYPTAGSPIGRNYSSAAMWKGEGFARHTHAMGGMVDITQRTFAHNVVLQGASPVIAYTAGNVLYRPGGASAVLGSVAVASWGCPSAGNPAGRNYNSAGFLKGQGVAEHIPGGVVDVASKSFRRGDCPQMPSYGVDSSKQTELSITHANDDVVAAPAANEEACLRAGCWRPRSGGLGATGTSELCFEHATTIKVSTRVKHCRQEGCMLSPSYGLAGSTELEYCSKHRSDGMVNNRRKKCGGKGCSSTPTFRFLGIRGKRLCSKHALPGMVRAFRAQCAHDNCIKLPTYGNEESRSRTFCAEHALDGMVDNASKLCAREGCRTSATYGIVGTKSGVVCAKHASKGMVNVVTKRCAHQGCPKTPTYGVAGGTKREFCAPHKLPGMVNISKRICIHQECSKMPSFGFEKNRKWNFCGEHAAEGMVSKNPKSRGGTRRTRRARAPPLPAPSTEQVTCEGASLAGVVVGGS